MATSTKPKMGVLTTDPDTLLRAVKNAEASLALLDRGFKGEELQLQLEAAQVQIEAGEDVGAIASVLWLTLLRAWLTMVPGTTTSLHLQSIIRGLACSAYDYRGRTLSPCDPDAARMMHGLLSHAAYPKKAQPMASVILGDPKVFCALTCLVDVSVGVLAFGMTLPEACRALMQDLHNLDEEDTRKCTAFREAVDALQALGADDAQLAFDKQGSVVLVLRAMRDKVLLEKRDTRKPKALRNTDVSQSLRGPRRPQRPRKLSEVDPQDPYWLQKQQI